MARRRGSDLYDVSRSCTFVTYKPGHLLRIKSTGLAGILRWTVYSIVLLCTVSGQEQTSRQDKFIETTCDHPAFQAQTSS